MTKRLLSCIWFCLILLSGAAVHAEEGTCYRINSVTLDSQEKTDPKMLFRKMPPIEKERIFESQDELEAYLDYIRQQLENTRLLEKIEYRWEALPGEGDVQLVDAVYSFEDSSSLMIVPYPTYSSNTGLQATLMLSDQNFLGKTNPLVSFLNCNFGTEEEPDNFSKITPGGGLRYDFPFNVGPVTATWKNEMALAWTIGDSRPEFIVNTGPLLQIPVGKRELDFSFTQTAVGNDDFEKYDDELYFRESAQLSLPLTIAKIGTGNPLVYRPYVSGSYTWDADGINENNHRLHASPKLTVGQTTGVNGIDWKGNFRNGYAFSTTQAITRNFREGELARGIIPYIDGDIKLFKAWKYAGLAANLHFFTMFNVEKNRDESALINIGPRLRGALDKQTFAPGYEVRGEYNLALETDQAVILSLEAPVHLLTTRFSGFLSAINVEMQISPFADIALFKNRARRGGTDVGKVFDLNEGIYCAGVEGFLYPSKFKSYVLHTSIGFDVGSFLIKDYNKDWRSYEKGWELSIGFGHHF